MYLEKIEVQGFKSLATKTLLTFPSPEKGTRGVTAIVGPNGSGKSNCADAMRWVLGEQSMKNLRSKRSEDVIFFGSTTRASVGMCEVSLYFNNDDHGFPLDFSEVVITRRLYRSGESEYLINKNKVRLSDLTLLLAQAHVGQRSYCIVSQGMIDAILTATPTERKEYFDDAAGIREYQIKKDSAESKLKHTRENLTQSDLLLKELEPKVRFLERQMKKRAQRAEVEKEYVDLLKAYYAAIFHDYEKKRAVARSVHERTQAFSMACEEKCEKLRTSLNEYQEVPGGQKSASISELQKKLDGLQDAKTTLQTSLMQQGTKFGDVVAQALKEELRRGIERQGLLTREIETLFSQEKQVEKELEGYSLTEVQGASQDSLLSDLQAILVLRDGVHELSTIEKLKKFIEDIFEQVYSLVGRLQHATSRTQESVDELFAKRESLVARMHELRARRERLEQERHEIQEECTQKEAQIQNKGVQGAKGSPQQAFDDLTVQIESARNALYQAYRKGEETTTALVTIQKELQELQQELSSLQREESEARVELAKLEARHEELQNTVLEELRLDEEIRIQILNGQQKLMTFLTTERSIDDKEEAHKELERLKKTLESIGSVDEEALQEYESTKERYTFLGGQVNDLEQAMQKLGLGIQELDGIMEDRFIKAMKKINEKFQEYFSTLFNGGFARIVILNSTRTKSGDQEDDQELETEPDEIVSGIDIEASPPGKKLKSIALLSGGERALTAIALLCAILSTNPSPFVVLDEVDAALDESNALRFAAILQELAKKTQFIVITHNRVTIHTAQVLYGVTMGDDGVSHVLSLDVRRASDTIASNS